MLRKIRSRLPLRRHFLPSLSIYHDWAIGVSGFSSYCSLSVLLILGFGIGDIVEGTANGGGGQWTALPNLTFATRFSGVLFTVPSLFPFSFPLFYFAFRSDRLVMAFMRYPAFFGSFFPFFFLYFLQHVSCGPDLNYHFFH